MMGDIKFLDTLKAYDKDNIPQVSVSKDDSFVISLWFQ